MVLVDTLVSGVHDEGHVECCGQADEFGESRYGYLQSQPSIGVEPRTDTRPGQQGSTNHSIGSINCLGSLNGHHIVGPGSVTDDGNVFGNCVQGTGSGTFRLSIPIAGGTNFPLSEKYTVQYVGIVGTFSGPVFSGVFEFLPQSGDCPLTPLTQVAVLAQGTITS